VLFTYRATAECDACGKVVDVGPFEDVTAAIQQGLTGWLTSRDGWMIRDVTGTPVDLCAECMGRPVGAVLADVAVRRALPCLPPR
jgi:hypothetical protein